MYGTQVTRRDGAWVPRNLRDPAGVDARRAAADLGPLTEYLRLFDDYPVQTSQLKCPGCGAWAPFEPPEGDEPVVVTCPECALETAVTLKR
jgi:hypothetical protein